jgi:hypothetical protein
MTDDIVTRLRTADQYWATVLFAESADEIERLRAEVNLWMGVAERFAESHPQHEAFQYYFRARTR